MRGVIVSVRYKTLGQIVQPLNPWWNFIIYGFYHWLWSGCNTLIALNLSSGSFFIYRVHSNVLVFSAWHLFSVVLAWLFFCICSYFYICYCLSILIDKQFVRNVSNGRYRSSLKCLSNGRYRSSLKCLWGQYFLFLSFLLFFFFLSL